MGLPDPSLPVVICTQDSRRYKELQNSLGCGVAKVAEPAFGDNPALWRHEEASPCKEIRGRLQARAEESSGGPRSHPQHRGAGLGASGGAQGLWPVGPQEHLTVLFILSCGARGLSKRKGQVQGPTTSVRTKSGAKSWRRLDGHREPRGVDSQCRTGGRKTVVPWDAGRSSSALQS